MKRLIETTARLFGIGSKPEEQRIGHPVSRSATVAQGKRAARKARNVKRHKAAMRRAA